MGGCPLSPPRMSQVQWEKRVNKEYGIYKKKKKKIIFSGKVNGCSRSVIQDCGCDQEGRKLSQEARVEEVGFEVLPKRCNRGTVSYMKGERAQKNRGIVIEGIRKVFD